MSKEDLARLDWDALALAYALGYVNTRWRIHGKRHIELLVHD